jgi:hypothetical protein
MFIEASTAMFFFLDGFAGDLIFFAWAGVIFFAVSHLFTRDFKEL